MIVGETENMLTEKYGEEAEIEEFIEDLIASKIVFSVWQYLPL